MEVDFDTVTSERLGELLAHADGRLRADAACALGDRLRVRELEQLGPLQPRLVELLADPVFLVRLEAAIALAEVGDTRGTDVLVEGLGVRSHRLDAIRALGTMGDRRAIPPLARLLDRWLLPWADRLQAAAALCALEDARGAIYLEERLHSRRRAERAAAIHFMGESKHPRAKECLGGLLDNPREPLRDVVARALGLLGDPSTRASLQAALETADAELRSDIQDALAKLDSPTQPVSGPSETSD